MMSDSLFPTSDENIASFMYESGVDPYAEDQAYVPIYKVDASSKILVSKKQGKYYQGQFDLGSKSRKTHSTSWDEAIRYYNNAQDGHRAGIEGQSGNQYFAIRHNKHNSETENVVYANVRAMIPAVYAKNPTVEFTCDAEQYKDYVQQLEWVVNKLSDVRAAPGLNLKMHVKQAITCTELCNIAWLEVGYTTKDVSREAAMSELNDLSIKLEEAKDEKAIREIEGCIMALEDQMDSVNPAGPFVKYRPAHSIIVDAASVLPDFSDAQVMFSDETWPTAYLNARYGEKDEDGRVMSIYEPTAVLSAGADSALDIESSLTNIIENNSEPKAYGYENVDQLKKAYRTRCIRVWDKRTRRVSLYAFNKWDWPIWVENDPYGLPTFFPYVPMVFNTTPLSAYARSNVSYYLDQQDGINEIHSQFHRERKDAIDNVLFDNRFDKETIEKWLTGGNSPTAHGVAVPDGLKLSDALMQKPSVLASKLPLFDTQRLMSSIDRVSGMTDIMRGVQFKTNTTNKAIESYNSTTATRLDERIDSIEDAIGWTLYNVAYMCAQFMSIDQVVMLVGEERAKAWSNYGADELRHMFTCEVVGGSTQKPTRDAKRQQALQMVDLLSKSLQFAPSTTMKIILTVLDDAFNDLSLPPNTFDDIAKEAAVAMQRGNSTPGGGAAQSGSMTPQSMSPSAQPDGVASPSGENIAELVKSIDALPPEAKLALGQILSKGVSIAEALPEVLQAAQQSGPPTGAM
jgi:hypothetical protein